MASPWVTEYANNARFDKLKFRWNDTHPQFTAMVDEVFRFAYSRLLEEYPSQALIPPKVTELPPSPNKPNGKYLIEVWGFACTLCKYLPSEYIAQLTYADVKAWVLPSPDGDLLALDEFFRSAPGPRNYVPTYPGSKNKTPKNNGMPSLRNGSRYSGIHTIIYRHGSNPLGYEAKFRDEQLHSRTMHVLDLLESGMVAKEQAWPTLCRLLALKGGEVFSQDFYARQGDVSDKGFPTSYELAKSGALDYTSAVVGWQSRNGRSWE